MGAAASIPSSKEEALAEGYTEEQIQEFMKKSEDNTAKLEMDMLMSDTLDSGAAKTMTKPTPQTTGFVFADSMFEYTLNGTWDKRAWEEYASEAVQNTPEALDHWHGMTIEQQRPMVDSYADDFNSKAPNQAYLAKVTASQIEIDTTLYAPCDNPSLNVLVFRPPGELLGLDGKPRPAMVYCHSGPGVHHSAAQFSGLAARFAVDYGIVVFSVDYRLAPEHKAPAAPFDAVGTVLHIRDNAEKLTIDPERIVMSGDAGGATAIVAAVMDLVKRGLDNVVKLVLPTFPLVSDLYVREGVKLDGVESIWGKSWHQIVRHLRPSPTDEAATAAFDDSYIFPTKMAPEIAAKFPMTVIVTSEFDVTRRCAEELAELLHKQGRLADFLCHPGVTSSWYMNMENPKTGVFWADIRKVFQKFLMLDTTTEVTTAAKVGEAQKPETQLAQGSAKAETKTDASVTKPVKEGNSVTVVDASKD